MNIKEILATGESRFNFLKGLMRIANADGIVDDDEVGFFKQAAVALELGEAEIENLEKQESSENDIYPVFKTNREKMFFLIQAVQLCWIDNNYSDTEKKEIRKICQEMNISNDALEAVEKWVDEGMKWNRRGEDLLKLS